MGDRKLCLGTSDWRGQYMHNNQAFGQRRHPKVSPLLAAYQIVYVNI